MARETKFKFANYDGGMNSHPTPEPKGMLVFKPNGMWELHYAGGFGKRDRWIHGGITRYPFTVTETSPSSCRVTVSDTQDPAISAAFDLPETPASVLHEALSTQQQSVAATHERQQKIASGSWWLAPQAFKGLGFSGSFSATETHYLGGWSGHPKTYTGKLTKIVVIDKSGISLRGLSTIFTIPWDQILDLEVEGPETASKRVTAGRALALGVFALAAKKTTKSAVLIARLRSGEEAIFQTEKFTAAELRAKLAPITSQLRKANASSSPTALPATSSPFFTAPSSNGSPAAAVSVADELKKLAELKDAELLTDEEFAGQKAKLLDP